MGFKQKEGGRYFTIYNGKFTVKADENTPGAVSRMNKEDKLVWEVYHDSFEGKLIKIGTKESPYGRSWIFVFTDGEGAVYNLNLPYGNSFAVALLKMLPNVNLGEKMELTPVSKEVDGKKQNSLFVKQNGVNVKHFYTKDNPNGLPDLEQIVVKGQKVWDDTRRLEFLQAMVERDILPKLEGATTHPADDLSVSESNLEDVEDDQPF